MALREIAEALGKGLVAGAAGTAAMTVSSTLEMKLTQRQASAVPGEAAGKVLGVEPKGEQEKQRFSSFVHYAYGTSWGAVRGLIGAAGLADVPAAVLHLALVWGTALVMQPSLGVAPPPTQWGAKALGTDLLHHVVYAAATSGAYELLDRR